jgi:UDP-glucose 4-epimerase
MQKCNVKRIVFSSSATVYGMDNPSPLTEDMPLNAVSPYGGTKLTIENILKDLFVSDSDWAVSLLRYFNPIGAHESGRIGEDPQGIPNNLMPYIAQVAVGKRDHLNIYGNDYDTYDGTGIRDYIHVSDLARGHIAALRRILSPCFSGVEAFNLGTGKGHSVLDVVRAFEKVSGVKIPYIITGRRAGDVAVCYADPSKSQKILGWKAEKSLEDMCRDAWNWQKNNPYGYDT